MVSKKFGAIKPEIRILGVDDGVFTPHTRTLALIVGVVFRGGYWLDGVMHSKIEVDGFDSTQKIVSMIMNSPHYKQLRVIMLNGITYAGFNIVNIKDLYEKTNLPVIAVTRDEPDLNKIHRALENLPKSKTRRDLINAAGDIIEVSTCSRNEKIYLQLAGILEEDAKKIVKLTSTRSSIPEPLRVAHLIASGVTEA